MTNDMVLIALVGATIFLLFVFVYMRDVSLGKKLKAYEQAFESMNKNIFTLEKRLRNSHNVQDQADVIKQVIAKELTPLTQTLVTTLKDVQTNQHLFATSIESRVKALEEKSKALYTPTSDLGVDHDRAIAMYNQGYTAEEIAKELRTTIGSVEFVLKLRDKER